MRLRDHVASKHLDCHGFLSLILSPDGTDLQKRLAHSVWTTDTFHAATLVRTIFVENFGDGVLHQYCQNYLQNLWVGGLEKELS